MPANTAQTGETFTVTTTSVPCDGDGGALGHPRVFLKINPATGDVVCPYCSRRFVRAPNAKVASGH